MKTMTKTHKNLAATKGKYTSRRAKPIVLNYISIKV